jgi:hypothetical protein
VDQVAREPLHHLHALIFSASYWCELTFGQVGVEARDTRKELQYCLG